jgi:hypothetical protein
MFVALEAYLSNPSSSCFLANELEAQNAGHRGRHETRIGERRELHAVSCDGRQNQGIIEAWPDLPGLLAPGFRRHRRSAGGMAAHEMMPITVPRGRALSLGRPVASACVSIMF